MRTLAAIAFGLSLSAATVAHASGCPGNPGALGTSRILKIDPRDYPRLGTVQYQDTLPLNDKEVVLTFDDGPMPPYTNRVLETLAHECVKANYFVVGRMARGYPELLRRIHTEGHVIGTHSENHPLAFERMPQRQVQQEIDQGFASTTQALGAHGTVAPFFRIPGLLRADNVERYLEARNMVTWSADVVADDWKHITASEVVSRAIARLDAKGKGILLLHDIQPATALAMPHLLRELKKRGYKIVQVVPESAPAMVARAVPLQQPAALAQAAPPAVQPQRAPDGPHIPFPATTPPPAVAAPAAAPASPPAAAITPAPPARPSAPPPAATAAVPQPAGNAPSVQQTRPAPNVTVTVIHQGTVRAADAGLPPEVAAAHASPLPAPETDAFPMRRSMPVPILEAGRHVVRGSEVERMGHLQLARPLTPAFKPSHSDSAPTKIADLPAEPLPPAPVPQSAPAEPPVEQPPGAVPQAPDAPEAEQPGAPGRHLDFFSSRASLSPRPPGSWPVTASSLAQASPGHGVRR